MNWTDVFRIVRRAPRRSPGNKSLTADVITWQGAFNSNPMLVTSTVRLTYGGLAHFLISSNARIGAHDYNIPGGHYVDLCVESLYPLSDSDLLTLARLAARQDERPIRIRRRGQRLGEAIGDVSNEPNPD